MGLPDLLVTARITAGLRSARMSSETRRTVVAAPETRYAKSGDLSIAYAAYGDGPDLVVAPGWISHLEVGREEPSLAHFYDRLATFRRVITFDKRGTGLSDPVPHAPTLEENVEDLRAVMDAGGSQRADVAGVSEAVPWPLCTRPCIPNARVRSCSTARTPGCCGFPITRAA